MDESKFKKAKEDNPEFYITQHKGTETPQVHKLISATQPETRELNVITLDPNQIYESEEKIANKIDLSLSLQIPREQTLNNYYRDRIENSAKTSDKGIFKKCPVCKKKRAVDVKYYIELQTHLAAILLIFVCLCCIFPLPYCIKPCKRKIFNCSHCKVSFSPI